MNIRNKLKFIIPAILLAIGIVLCVIGLAMGAIGDYKENLDLNDFEANIPVSNIFNLDIEVPIADIYIISSNDVNDFYISAHNITKSFLDYSTSDNTLRLTYNTKKWYHAVLLPGYRNCEGVIELYVPAKLNLKDVEISSEYGNTKINYLTAERVFIDCSSGDNQIKNLTCNYTEINNQSGDINAMNIDAESVDLNFTSGNSVFTNFVSNSVMINNKRNDIHISGMIKGDSSVQTGSGDVNLTLYGEMSDYNFKSIDGNAIVNGKEAEPNKDGKYLFKIKGDVNINVK